MSWDYESVLTIAAYYKEKGTKVFKHFIMDIIKKKPLTKK
ncbi:hypothetical protein I010_10796 [Pasteurella multocida 1500C]|nr:hypothetical protein KCU_03456 [Pasteurella multocida subsp. multocida str. P52VAC]EPE73258.1 hypothetical protein I010_10796 [Pasteurella multocida 1500C]ERL42186.1 hypothetical protein B654_03201 [Pasteurella multocida subsp. multocida str. PMTB]